MENWEDLKVQLLYGFNTPGFKREYIAMFLKFVDDIIKTEKIGEPFSDKTDDFTDVFVPQFTEACLKTKPSNDDIKEICGAVLQSVTKLFCFYLDKPRTALMRSAAMILISRECPFFTATAKLSWIGTVDDRPFFNKCLATFKSCKPIDKIIAFLESEKPISFQYMCVIIDLFVARKEDFGADVAQKIVFEIANRIMILSNSPTLALREIDEDYTEPLFNRFFANLRNQNALNELRKLRIDLYVKFVKSDFLTKKFVGLKNINSILEKSPDLTHFIAKSQIVEDTLPEMHEQLVPEMSKLLLSLSKANALNHVHFTMLWATIANQNQSMMGKYLIGVYPLLNDATTGRHNTEELFSAIVELDKYNPVILHFMKQFAPKLPETAKNFVYTSLQKQISKLEAPDKIYLDTLCAFLPNDANTRLSLQKTMLIQMKNGQNTAVCLEILSQLSSTMTNDDLNDYVDVLLKAMTSSKDPLQYLSVLSNTLARRDRTIDNSTYERIADVILPYFSTSQEKVSDFFGTMLKGNVLTTEMLQQLYLFYSSLEEIEEPAVEVVILLFEKINQNPNQHIGMKELIALYMKTGNKELLSFIIEKHVNARSAKFTKDFIDECFSNVSENSLNAVLAFLYRTESGLDKSKFLFQENRVLISNDTIKVKVAGDYNGILSMPKEATFISVIDYFADLYSTKQKSIKLSIDNEEIDPFTKKMENGMTVFLSVAEKGTEKPLTKENLPSFYVSDPKYANVLHSHLISPQSEFHELSYKILEKIPSLNVEIEAIDNAQTVEEAFPKNNLYLCIYRLSAIARIIMGSAEGAEQLIEKGYDDYIPKFVLTNAPELLADNDNYFIYILEILALFIKRLPGTDKFTTLFYSSITKILDDYSEKNTIIVSTLLSIIVMIKPKEVFNEQFASFFSKVVLSTKKKIVVPMLIICKTVEPEVYMKIITDALPNALYVEDSLVSKLLPYVSSEIKETTELWSALTEVIVKFAPSDDMKLVDQLIFQIPCKSISNAVYEAMLNLLSKNAKLKKQAEIMKFIVEKIMFSQVCYYDITEELLNLVEQLINLNSDCTSIILPYIKEAMKIKRDGKERINFSIQSAPRKGLTNLGATCYMNSVLQQMFHIPEFRNAILLEKPCEAGSWQNELQTLFCNLLFAPENYVSTQGFASSWKGWDEEQLNVRQQMDAIEFLSAFIDKVSGSFKNAAELVTGKITHKTVIESDQSVANETTEPFVTIPLEIKNVASVEESLKIFKNPSHIKYQTNDKKDIDALQYSKISAFPDVLILQLKRFEYNISTCKREKVNSCYTFPQDLSIENNEYKLRGIVIHTGNAQSGHYYSFIKETGEESWYEYNDIYVSKISDQEIKKRSTGGREVKKVFSRMMMTYQRVVIEKTANAYLLIYEKAGKEASPIQMSSELLDEEKDRIKKGIWQRIPAHPSFKKLFEVIVQNDKGGELVFSNIINAIANCEGREKIKKLAETAMNACDENENLRNNLLDLEIYKKYIVHSSNDANREIILDLIIKSLELSSDEKKKEYIDSLSLYILNDSFEFMSNWSSFKYCFKPFEVCPEASENEKKIANELFFQTFETFDSLNPAVKLYENVHCDGILAVISCYDEQTISSLFTKDKILVLLTLPDQDSKYIAKIIEVVHKNGALFNLINDSSITLSPMSNARIYQLALCQTGTDKLLKKIENNVFKSKSTMFIAKFLKSFTLVAPLLKQNRRRFIDRSKNFVQYYLLSLNQNMRDLLRDLVYALFPEYPKKPTLNNKLCSDMEAFFQIMIELLPMLESQLYRASEQEYASFDFETLCPSPHYFFILHWLYASSNLKNDVILAAKKFLVFLTNMKKSIQKVNPRIDLLDFLSFTLKCGLYETFFIQVRYEDFIDAFSDITDSTFRSIDVSSELAEITPQSKVGVFIGSTHGKRLFDYGFREGKGAEIENFLSNREKYVDWKLVKEKVWRDYIVNFSIKSNCIEFVRISGNILMNTNSSTLDFEKLLIHEKMLQSLLQIIKTNAPNADDYYTAVCHCLVYFNKKYFNENKSKKTMFGSLYTAKLIGNLLDNNLDFGCFINYTMKNPEKAESTLRLLDSFAILGEKISMHFLKLIPANFLTFFTGQNLNFAINLISNCLAQIVDSNYLAAFVEKQCKGIAITHPNAADRFLSSLSCIIDNEYNPRILQSIANTCNWILSSADDPNILTGTTLFIAATVYDKHVANVVLNVRKWVEHVYDLINEWLKNLPDSLQKLSTIKIFIGSIKSTFGFSMPKLQIEPSVLEEAMKNLQSLENEAANNVMEFILSLQA